MGYTHIGVFCEGRTAGGVRRVLIGNDASDTFILISPKE